MDVRPSPRSLVRAAVAFYAAMIALGLIILAAQGADIGHVVFGVEGTALRDALLGAGAGLAVVGLTWSVRRAGAVRRLNAELGALLGELDSTAIAVLAVASAVGEELLFRGALQPLLGFWWTALLFGAVHGGATPRLWVWAVFATLAGALLGGLALYTESLLAPIVCHLTVNFWNLHAMADAAAPPTAPDATP